MNLSQKIFITFFITVTALLSTTLSLIETKAETHEVERIIENLNNVQTKFQHDLEARQQHIQMLSHVITTDQKFRSFLSQIKDNFYPFTNEIGKDTQADFVFMLDDEPSIRAFYAKNKQITSPLKNQFSAFEIETHLDSASRYSKMIGLEGGLYSSHFIPLKENLKDDYAVGLIVVINQINDVWVTKLLSRNVSFQAVFFNKNKIVAKNTGVELANTMLENQHVIIESGMFRWNNQRYISKQVLFDSQNLESGYFLSANLDEALSEFKQLQQQILLIGGGILLIGTLLFLWIARRITQPLRLITKGTLAIEEGDYQHRIDYQNSDEVGKLAHSFNSMAEGLEEKQMIRETFSSYVDPVIVSELLSQPKNLKLGGERKEQSVLFSDIAGFTNFSERLPAETLVQVLNEYLTAMTEEISLQQGILDKFIGDAIMAFWSPRHCNNQHAQLACETALNMQETLKKLRPIWQKHEDVEIYVRIGIATGDMIVGNIGSEKARSYTCIGDKVNYSSRLEGLNKYYGTHIMIDEQTDENITGFITRELDTVKVKGREQGEVIYELVGKEGQIKASELKMLDAYQKALDNYRKGNFSQAAHVFTILKNDPASQVMLGRCLVLEQNPPENWQGIHAMLDK